MECRIFPSLLRACGVGRMTRRQWCKVSEFQGASKPVYLSKAGGEGVLYVHKEWQFTLLNNGNERGWNLPYRSVPTQVGGLSAMRVGFGDWEIVVKLQSRGTSRTERFEFQARKGAAVVVGERIKP
jgi:hypothetical protein